MRRLRTVVQNAKSGITSSTSTWRPGLTASYHANTATVRYKLALLAGFSLFAIGVFAANQSPANGYEVSIYWATPSLYWLGAGGALLIAGGTLLYDHENPLSPLSMLLGVTSVASFLALPVIRNYYFHGYSDPMTHLGSIRAFKGGFLSFVDPVYPGTYAATTLLSSFSGLPVNRTMLYVMFLFGLVFLFFVPLTVTAIVPGRLAAVLGLFAGFLFLPINNVSLFYRFHPFSLATLYFPLVAYLLVSHVTNAHDGNGLRRRLSGSALALPVATTGILFFHPQATVNTLIIFAMVVGLHATARRYFTDHPLAQQRAIYGQFLFLSVLFLVWVSLHEGGAGRTVTALIDGIFGWISGNGETASVVRARTSSADSIGVSIVELFVKYFLVSALFSLLATGAIVANLIGRLPDASTHWSRSESHPHVLTVFAIGGVGLLPYIFIHSLGRADDYLFRHIGFWMAVVTILGAVGLFYLLRVASIRLGDSTTVLKGVFGVVAAVLLVLSLLALYSSPFLYLPGQHVSEQEMKGMEAAFEMQPEDRSVWFSGVRQNPNRYEDAMFAAPNVSWNESPNIRATKPVTNENITRLKAYYENHPEEISRRDHYLVISEQDYQTETVAYDGVRYTRENISTVDQQSAVHRIYSNGESTVYYVDTVGTPKVGAGEDGNTTTEATSNATGRESSESMLADVRDRIVQAVPGEARPSLGILAAVVPGKPLKSVAE